MQTYVYNIKSLFLNEQLLPWLFVSIKKLRACHSGMIYQNISWYYLLVSNIAIFGM